MRIVDTHQHLIYPDQFGYAWTRGLEALEGKTLGLEEYWAAAEGTGIERALFMEVDVDEARMGREAQFFSAMTRNSGAHMAGVIAASRPEREGFEAYLDSIQRPEIKGLRRILHTQRDDLCAEPLFVRNLATLARRRLSFDLCLLPRQLPHASAVLRGAADVQFVLDHCGIPNIRGQELDPWRRHVRELANFPNLACKISGLVAYCDPGNVSVAAIRPFVEHCVECFGWDRVLFGGDWPVCNLTSSLSSWVAIAKEIFGRESTERQEKFFSRNAERVYQLHP